jgi:long-chain acyl-CoA synthetase
MHPMHHAAATPEKPAIVMNGSGASLTYGQLEARSNQVAQLLRARGLGQGDSIAVLMENCPEYFEIAWGAQRAGLYFACISTKLTADEVAYILADSGAKAVFATPGLASVAAAAADQVPGVASRLAVGGDVPGFERFETARDSQTTGRIADESAGADMLYSSGTTGRPKGIRVPLTGAPIDAPNPLQMMANALFGIQQDAVYLSPAPLYHAAPLRWCMSVHKIGGTVVVMEKFDPEAYLAAVQTHKVTDSQLVPTMFVRMLKLPEAVRASYDVSSLKMAVHAAAPCPVPVKEQMIDWWGPIIFEYYAGTEGNGFCMLSASEWLNKKGSVGRALLGELKIVGEAGEVVPTGESGTVYFANGPQFEYHNAPEKTADSRNSQGWTTLGDVGYVDGDGYLFLTDRKAFMIISGGVNIYPQEAENVLVTHPKVADVAVFGVPNEEMGEEVKAVIQPVSMADAGPDLAAELMGWCRERLSHIKCPRSVDFLEELPRHPTGKLYKRLLRDQYWTGRTSTIV